MTAVPRRPRLESATAEEQARATNLAVSNKISREDQGIFDLILETCDSLASPAAPRLVSGFPPDPRETLVVALEGGRHAGFGSKIQNLAALKSHAVQIRSVKIVRWSRFEEEEVEFGTRRRRVRFAAWRPPDSALFTCQGLTWSLERREVEDWTQGEGWKDVFRREVLRLRDPDSEERISLVRAVRGARAAGRLGLTLEAGTATSIRKRAIPLEISRERVGEELMRLLGSEEPVAALESLESMGLLEVALGPPAGAVFARWGAASLGVRVARVLRRNLGSSFEELDREARPVLFLSALLIAWRGAARGPAPATRRLVRDSLRLSKKTSRLVERTHAAASGFLRALVRPRTEPAFRRDLGRLCWRAGPLWAHGLELAVAELECARFASSDAAESAEKFRLESKHLALRIRYAFKFDEDLRARLRRDPILSARDLARLLRIEGRDLGRALEMVRDFVFLHPHRSGDDDYKRKCEEFLKETWDRRERFRAELRARSDASEISWSDCERFGLVVVTKTEMCVRGDPRIGSRFLESDARGQDPNLEEEIIVLPPGSQLVAIDPVEADSTCWTREDGEGLRRVRVLRRSKAARKKQSVENRSR